MVTASNQIFRITYEAFSKFSNHLTNCRSFADVEKCFRIHLKYLFNFHVFRANFRHNNVFIHLVCSRGKAVVRESSTPCYLPYEEILLNENKPLEWKDISQLNLPGEFSLPPDEEGVLNGWNFFSDERLVTVSVLSGKSKIFTQKDITFLQLVADNIGAKLFEICLVKKLDETNNEIKKINLLQQEIIDERTKEIAGKNKVLLEISVLNAHALREPLARILGLIELINSGLDIDLVTEIIPRLSQSSHDLDEALQDVINRTTKDLINLNATYSHEHNNDS